MPVYLDTAFRPFYGCGHRRVVLVSVAIGSLSRHVTEREREREGCCDLMGLKIWQVAGGPIRSEKQPELND